MQISHPNTYQFLFRVERREEACNQPTTCAKTGGSPVGICPYTTQECQTFATFQCKWIESASLSGSPDCLLLRIIVIVNSRLFLPKVGIEEIECRTWKSRVRVGSRAITWTTCIRRSSSYDGKKVQQSASVRNMQNQVFFVHKYPKTSHQRSLRVFGVAMRIHSRSRIDRLPKKDRRADHPRGGHRRSPPQEKLLIRDCYHVSLGINSHWFHRRWCLITHLKSRHQKWEHHPRMNQSTEWPGSSTLRKESPRQPRSGTAWWRMKNWTFWTCDFEKKKILLNNGEYDELADLPALMRS